jgi:hypothetical protein
MNAAQSAGNRLVPQATARDAVVRIRHHLDISMDAVEDFCRRWHVLERVRERWMAGLAHGGIGALGWATAIIPSTGRD